MNHKYKVLLNLLNIKNIFYQSNERNCSFKSFLLQLNRKGLLEDFRKKRNKMWTLKNLSACTMTLIFHSLTQKASIFVIVRHLWPSLALSGAWWDSIAREDACLVFSDLTLKSKSKSVFKWQTCKLLRQRIRCRCQIFYCAAIVESFRCIFVSINH